MDASHDSLARRESDRLSDEELARLLRDLESHRVERKESDKDRDKLCEAICAFANDMPGEGLPGHLLIGARDDGSLAGLRVTDDMLTALADLRSNGNVLPFPAMTVEKRSIAGGGGGGDLVVVTVRPADAPPVRYKGRTWIRVGSRRGVASAQEERILAERRRSLDHPYDLRPISHATINDLNADAFRIYLVASVAADVLAENGRTTEEQMMSLRFAFRREGVLVPTVLGLLVVGRDPRDILPGAYVQFLRIDGASLADPIVDSQIVSAPLGRAMEELDAILASNIRVSVDIVSSPREIRSPDYPLTALQQLVRNAILHRTYEGTNAPVRVEWYRDRIEIRSPGGPYGLVTAENFGSPGATDYRNPHLAEVMRELGFIQKFGAGILIARQDLEKNGNPPPEFTIHSNDVHVLIRKAVR